MSALTVLLPLLLASTEEELAGWVPAKLLAAALLALVSAGLTVFGLATRALVKRLDALDSAVEKATSEISKLGNFATREELTEKLSLTREQILTGQRSMGNGFEQKITEMNREIGALNVRCARLEERAAARVRK